MTDHDSLEDRLLRATHEPGADLELLAHEIGASEDAQAYLVALVETLSSISAKSPAAQRAAALLEQGLAVAAELGADQVDSESTSTPKERTFGSPDDDRER